ncbi:MAG: hypothetical protein ACREJC_10840, partial [Tepidisphaeraceae bacterium]
VLNRVASGLEGHKGPPGYYLLTVWVTFFPWSIVLPGAILYGWKHRGDPINRFALCAIVGPWMMFEIVQTKLPHYLLPAFPWMALLTARMLIAWRRRYPRLLPRMTVGAVVMMFVIAIVYATVLPNVPWLRVSQRVADVLRRNEATDVIMIDYKEPSLAFYQGGSIREERENGFLVNTDPRRWPSWIVLTRRIWDRTPANLRERLDVVGTVSGLNYADRMREVEVMVVRTRRG